MQRRREILSCTTPIVNEMQITANLPQSIITVVKEPMKIDDEIIHMDKEESVALDSVLPFVDVERRLYYPVVGAIQREKWFHPLSYNGVGVSLVKRASLRCLRCTFSFLWMRVQMIEQSVFLMATPQSVSLLLRVDLLLRMEALCPVVRGGRATQ